MKVYRTFINLFFLAGAILVLVFIILSGSANATPFKKFYWVRADTSGIPGAFDTSAWTFWGVCLASDRSDCQLAPAFPLSPVDNFGTETGVPQDFIDNKKTYFYLSRFSFAFALVALGFAGFAFIVDILGFFFTSIDKVVVILVSLALFFVAGFAAFQTAVVVLARNAFKSSNLSTKIGTDLLALTWTAVVTILIVLINSVAATVVASYKDYVETIQPSSGAVGNDQSLFTRAAPEVKEEGSGGIRFFKIKRNNKVSDEESV